jgi:flavin reductase (DIM6/NTAB) family NADH-FMN oxidoreductase RutF/rubredoxin
MQIKAFHKLSYGMYLVASAWEGSRAGYVANTVFQVTSSPPRIAISCHKNNDTLQVILKSRIFSVSVLKKELDVSLIGEFGFMSSSWYDKFAKVRAEIKTTGAPVVIDACVAWLDCRLTDTLDVGSHMLLVGEVVDSALLSDEEPLTYAWYREKFKMVSPRNAPTYVDPQILEQEELLNPKEKGSEPPLRESPITGADRSASSISSGADQTSSLSFTTGPSGTSGGSQISSVQEFTRDPDDDEEYICVVCGHIYRPDEGDLAAGIAPGTPFHQLPEDYRCPICNAGKDYFKPMG